MKKYLLMALCCSSFFSKELNAQIDPHYTQYYANPQWLNPAMVGIIDGNSRVTLNYRKQLPDLSGSLQFKSVSADFTLPGNFGIGATVFSQNAADQGYQNTTAYLSISFQVHLSQYEILSSGFQFGMINKKIDPSKMQFSSQFNPLIGYDAGMVSNENFPFQSATIADGAIGLMYFNGNPESNYNPFFGASLSHPSQPVNRFLSSNYDNKIPMRFALHGGVRYRLTDKSEIIPHGILIMQGKYTELAAGLMYNLLLAEGKGLMLGGTYRLNDAMAPSVGMRIKGLTIGMSYDVLTSPLKTAASGNGGFELSISYTRQKRIPETRFICPRL